MNYTVYQQNLDSEKITILTSNLDEKSAINLAMKMNQVYKNTLDPYIFFVSRKSLKEIINGTRIQ